MSRFIGKGLTEEYIHVVKLQTFERVFDRIEDMLEQDHLSLFEAIRQSSAESYLTRKTLLVCIS